MLAKAVCQAASSPQTLRVRQQAGSYRRLRSPSAFDRVQSGPFPAEAGPTKSNACIQWDWLLPGMDAERPRIHNLAERGHHQQTSPTIAPRISRGTGFSREVLICFLSASDLRTQKAQSPPIATLVQAERRFRGVGRAAWMPREPPPAMDGGWRRAHGARPE